MISPFNIFEDWLAEEKRKGSARHPAACCLSTIGLDGYPNSRMVDLKALDAGGFIFTGTLSSRKGQEIRAQNKVSLNFWWPATQRQVRLQGDTVAITVEDANRYFMARSDDARLVAQISHQGEPIADYETLQQRFESAKQHPGSLMDRPDDWSGFHILPFRMEFFEFSHNRLHRRRLFDNATGEWQCTYLQP